MKKEEIRKYFDQIAGKRDRWKEKNRYYHDEIEKLLGFLVPGGASVLEVGCATGDILAALDPASGKGIDLSEKMIELARAKYPRLRFESGDVESMVEGEPFDYIILSDVIGYLDDVQRAIGELHKTTHERSRVIITYYNYLWEPVMRLAEALRLKQRQPFLNWLAPADLDNLLRLAGFETVKRGERLLFPVYIPLISTVLNRYVAKLPFIRKLCLVHYLVARPMPRGKKPDARPTVSVIIPARNEKGNIENAVKRLPAFGGRTEIIFVEGHSKDGTFEEIERVKAAHPERDIKIMKQDGKGKGDAVRKGLDAASGDILMILDADLTVPPEDLPKFYRALSSGAGDFINCSRLVYQLENESMRILNIFGNKFFGLMFSWLLDQRIKDTLCGTKALWKSDYEKIRRGRSFFGDFDPFGDYDLLFGAAKLNLKIVDLPIRYQARVYGSTQISRFTHGWLLLRMCFFAMRKIKFI